MHDHDTPAPITSEELADFVRVAVGHIATGIDHAQFIQRGLDDASHLIRLEDANAFDPAVSHRRAMVLGMLRSIWAYTPHPGSRYAPMPAPALERNAPCPCGSGRKHKACCLEVQQGVDLGDINYLPLLLDALPMSRWPELVKSRVRIDSVASTAAHWNGDGRAERAIALLRPWFETEAGFVAKHDLLFELLADAYVRAGQRDAQAALIARGMAARDRTIRSSAMQRQIMILSDAGDRTAAWALFKEAMRHEPDSPSLSHVEITLLASDGNDEMLRERAMFWARRLSLRRDDRLAPLVALMLDVHERGASALDDAVTHRPAIEALLDAIRARPQPQVHYNLDATDDDTNPLEPTPELAAALAAWHEASAGLPPDMDADAYRRHQVERGMAVMHDRPILWHCFEVLATIASVLEAEDVRGELRDIATELLDHASLLLDRVLGASGRPDGPLGWDWQENRPALGLLLMRARMDFDAATTPQILARLGRLLRLDPADRLGMREELMHRHLEAGDFAEAIALSDRYPDDRAAMRYHRVLALFGAGREYDAQRALHAAKADHPKVLAWLLKRNPKPPANDPLGIAAGSDQEAALYRDRAMPLWILHDAMDWLARTSRRLPR